MKEAEQKSEPSVKQLREFGRVMLVFFAIVTAVSFYRRGYTLATGAQVTAALAALFGVLSALAPRVLTVPYKVWMKFGAVMNFIMTRVILSLVYFVAVTPIGVLRRAGGADPLTRAKDAKATTYWVKREVGYEPTHYEKPY